MDGDEQEENLSAASRTIKKQLAARTVEVSAATCDDILRAALSLRSDQTGHIRPGTVALPGVTAVCTHAAPEMGGNECGRAARAAAERSQDPEAPDAATREQAALRDNARDYPPRFDLSQQEASPAPKGFLKIYPRNDSQRLRRGKRPHRRTRDDGGDRTGRRCRAD